MASHCHHHFHHPHSHHQQPPPPPPSTHCCCNNNNNPSFTYTCCPTPPHHPSPPLPQDHLLETIASLLSQQPHPINIIPTPHHYPKSHTFLTPQNYEPHQTHSTISSLLHRIETLESSLNHHTLRNNSCYYSLHDTAARVIQTHFRSFLVRRSRTLRHLKHLAFIKSTFNSLKSSFSNDTHFDFVALSRKALDLLLQLDSIEGCDPMIVDGKKSISRDLVQFLDSIERVAVKKHLFYVKAAKNARSQKVNKSRDACDDEKRKLLRNLKGRVERISRMCKLSANDGEDSEPKEGIHRVVDDDDVDGGRSVLISRRSGVSPNKSGVFVQMQGVQPRAKKSVRFAENGKIYELYSSSAYEQDLSGDMVCLDGSSSSDDQGEGAIEDVVDSAQGAGDDEEAPMDNGGSPHSSDDGERIDRKGLKNNGRNVVKDQLQEHQEKILFSAPLPLKMENRADLKSKGVRILT